MYTDYLMHYGIQGMKWGIRRFQEKGSSKRTIAGKKRYAHGCASLANRIYDNAVLVEPRITKVVKAVVKQSGAKTYGLSNRLKTKESLKRKIMTDSKQRGISFIKAANNVNDAIRYTALLNDDNFVSGYNSIRDSLSDQGFKEVRCRNYFDLYRKGKAKHKQITSVYEDQNSNRFEIQFHTPSSIKAKETKTPLYEEIRKADVSKERKTELEKKMTALASKVKTPKGVYKIKSYG